MDAGLAAALTADDAAEDAGMHADGRTTCHTHQSWFADCVTNPDGVHANPVTDFNWCRSHHQAVQRCRCRTATVNG